MTLGETFSKSYKRSQEDFASIWDAFTYWISKRFLKQHFSESGLTKIFTVYNFGNTFAMTIIFSSECLKVDWYSRNGTENWVKRFRFSYNCIWIGSCKFSQYWTRYLPSAVNVVRSTPKISFNTREDIFEINFPENYEKTWQKRSHGDFASIQDTFTCWLSKRFLKWRLLQGGLTKFVTVCNFGNTFSMTIIFFFKMFKIWLIFKKWNRKLRITCSFFR